jgi:hypothetical protein
MIIAGMMIITSVVMFRRSVQKSDTGTSVNPIYRGYGFFILGYAGTRIFFILSDFERYANGDQSPLYNQFVFAAYIIGIFSVLSLISPLEKNILNMKHRILSGLFIGLGLACVGIFIVLIFMPDLSAQIVQPFRYIIMGISFFGVFIVVGLYTKIIKDTTGALPKNATMTFIGIVLFFVGNVIDSELIIKFLNVPIWFPGIFPIIGFFFFLYGQRSI